MNVARLKVAKKLEIAGDFELSQSYLFAWDHIEKANHYLELQIELAEASARSTNSLRGVGAARLAPASVPQPEPS